LVFLSVRTLFWFANRWLIPLKPRLNPLINYLLEISYLYYIGCLSGDFMDYFRLLLCYYFYMDWSVGDIPLEDIMDCTIGFYY